jgi:hypothetical protein
VSGEPENGKPRKGVTQHMSFRFALQTSWPSDNFEFRVDDAHEIEFFHRRHWHHQAVMPCGTIVLPGRGPRKTSSALVLLAFLAGKFFVRRATKAVQALVGAGEGM